MKPSNHTPAIEPLNSIRLTISPEYSEQGDEAIMRRLKLILCGDIGHQDPWLDGPFPPTEAGSRRWRLNSSNDWWAELTAPSIEYNPDLPRVNLEDGMTILTLFHSARYGHRETDDSRLRALAEWAAVVFGGKVIHPYVWSHALARTGGEWLGVARRWMQTRFKNGEDVTWGSNDLLTGRSVTVADLEELAAHVAAAALNERNQHGR